MKSARLIRIHAQRAGDKGLAGKLSTADKVWNSARTILESNVLCSMATVSRRQRAHISTAYFCYSDQLELYFLSYPESVHCRNLARNSSAAITVFSPSQTWGGPDRGVQLFGNCREAKGARWLKAERLYGDRFPLYTKWRTNLQPGDPGQGLRFYHFMATSLKILDEKTLGDGLLCRAEVERSTK